MALTEPQARVLGVLAALKSPLTHAIVRTRLDGSLSEDAARDALDALTFRGLALRSDRKPAEWCITSTGRAVAALSRYADYRHPELPGTRSGEQKIETKEST